MSRGQSVWIHGHGWVSMKRPEPHSQWEHIAIRHLWIYFTTWTIQRTILLDNQISGVILGKVSFQACDALRVVFLDSLAYFMHCSVLATFNSSVHVKHEFGLTRSLNNTSFLAYAQVSTCFATSCMERGLPVVGLSLSIELLVIDCSSGESVFFD